MALAKEDVEQIQEMISAAISADVTSGTLPTNVRFELELRERIVRVEEELKHQRQLMIQGFEQMEKRFEAMDNRFEIITQRLDRLIFWSFGITISAAGLVIAALRLWPPG